MISKMTIPQKHMAALVLITLVVWGLSLRNFFTLDDGMLIQNNSFYSSTSNITKIFSNSYRSSSDLDLFASRKDKGSGSVAYRPILTLTYFLDSALWGKNPFGFHLTNLILHVVNVCLAYCLILGLFGQYGLAFLAALLFSIHPVQSEAICAIGFRADLLATFWTLLSVLSWLAFRGGKNAGFSFAVFFYFLALFSKEAAILLPLWILAFDRWKGIPWKKLFLSLIGFGVVAGFYLYIYFFIFPNAALDSLRIGGLQKLSIFGQIWAQYLVYFLVPSCVVPFPPQYWPFPRMLSLTSEIWFLIAIAVLAGVLLLRKSTPERPYYLMGLWAILFFAPASGIFSNPNPAALRYLYFPGVGVYLIMAAVLWAIALSEFMERLTKKWKALFLSFFIGMCLIGTFANIDYWQNNFTMGYILSRQFPDHFCGHVILGEFWTINGDYRKAVQEFNIALDDPRNNIPALIYTVGLDYLHLKDYDKARQAFEFLIEKGKDFGVGHRGMGMLLFFQKRYSEAIPYFERTLVLDPSPEDMTFLLQIYTNLGNDSKVAELLAKSKTLFPGTEIKRIDKKLHRKILIKTSDPFFENDVNFYAVSPK